VVAYLLEQGADPTLADVNGTTPAEAAKDPEIKALLEVRASVGG
jgi:hypothetical protein